MEETASQFLWKIGAPAGLGVMTTGLLMSKLMVRSGLHVYDTSEYPSLIKGGHNTAESLCSREPLATTKRVVDCLVCFNAETATLHAERLTQDSLILFDPSQFTPSITGVPVALPMQDLLNELQAEKVMINMVALGASCALVGGSFELLSELISEQFVHKKGTDIAEKNIACANAGFTYIQTHFASLCRPVLSSGVAQEERVLLAGNEAFSLGAVAADCKFYAAYPMSPSSSVLTTLAAWQEQTGMVVRHAEDEIGVVNETLGASFMGVRAATGTSGGGFALMTESISYAGVAELPIVVFIAQRPGPATGMPTWTEQGDLYCACFAGHGEFPKIVIAPGDPLEMVALTQEAFNLADSYQLPVIVLSDKNLSEAHESISASQLAEVLKKPIDRGKLLTTAPDGYKRYALSEDGISPRLNPGTPGTYFQANSYEHLEDSHTTEDAAIRVQQAQKRQQKINTYLSKDYPLPEVAGELASAQVILVSWGGTKGVVRTAWQRLTKKGQSVAHLHFTHVHPLSPELITPLLKHEATYIMIENNMTAQFAGLLRMATGFVPKHTVTRFDGRPIEAETLETNILELMK